MDASFRIESLNSSTAVVAHVGEGHRYTIPIISDARGRRVLSRGREIVSEGRTRHSGDYFEAEARSFAERAARAAGLID